MISATMAEEMAADALARRRAEVALLSDGEIVTQHEAEAARWGAVMARGGAVTQYDADRFIALQEERARRVTPPKPEQEATGPVGISWIDGAKLSFSVRCF